MYWVASEYLYREANRPSFWPFTNCYWYTNYSGVNGKPAYRISFCLGWNDGIRKEYFKYRLLNTSLY